MPRYRVSVVLPTYGRPQPLRVCLASLLEQSHPPDEIVVVMREGDHPTEVALKEFSTNPRDDAFPRIIVTTVSVPGVVCAQNKGFETTTGDLICCIDDDAFAPLDWLERLERYYDDPQVGAVGGRDRIFEEGQYLDGPTKTVGQVKWYGRVTGNHHLVLEAAQPLPVDHLKGCNMSLRRDVLTRLDENLRGYAHAYELDLCLTIKERGYRVLYDPALVVEHHPGPRFEHGGRDKLGVARLYVDNHNSMYVLLKHFPPLRKVALILFSFLIGDRGSWGLTRSVWELWTTRDVSHLVKLWAAWSGKSAGFLTYWRTRTPGAKNHCTSLDPR